MIFFDFAFYLFIPTAFFGIIYLLDVLFWARKRKNTMPKLVEYARAFFPVLLAVFLLRAFIAEPFRIPSGSMKPTLLEGDFILVHKFLYGLRLPIVGTKIWENEVPKAGDILVFRFPKDPSIDFIKRVVGVPGDTVTYKGNRLYLNGKELSLTKFSADYDYFNAKIVLPVQKASEQLGDITHDIFLRNDVMPPDMEAIVPPGHYFVMGDNRNSSEDSRTWGFVPDNLIIGKATFIWFSWDALQHIPRWHRLGAI